MNTTETHRAEEWTDGRGWTDGQVWHQELPDGTIHRLMTDLEYNSLAERGKGRIGDTPAEVWTFPDGSGVVMTEGGWDVFGPDKQSGWGTVRNDR